MNEMINKIFGNAVKEEPYALTGKVPNYIRYGYYVSSLRLNDMRCILVKPKTKEWNLATLKTQLRNIEEIAKEPAVLDLDRLTAAQRTNLIESGIAFVSGTGQVFIPFWGSYFEEKILNPAKPVEVLSANAQLVFLALYYNSAMEPLNQTKIAALLTIPKATCSRAIQQLNALNLISVTGVGAANRVCINERETVINRALPHMTSPVAKRLFVSSKPEQLHLKYTGIKALALDTMLAFSDSDPGYAVSKDISLSISREILIDEQSYRDFGGEIIEVWKYDPNLLSKGKRVDDISLYLELKDDPDERVQNELDAIRERYGIKGEEI